MKTEAKKNEEKEKKACFRDPGPAFGACRYGVLPGAGNPKLLEYRASDEAFRAIRENAVSNLDPTEKEKETEGQTETETEDLPDDLDTALHIDWKSLKGRIS